MNVGKAFRKEGGRRGVYPVLKQATRGLALLEERKHARWAEGSVNALEKEAGVCWPLWTSQAAWIKQREQSGCDESRGQLDKEWLMISFDLTSAETQRSCRVQRRREMIKTELAGDDSYSLCRTEWRNKTKETWNQLEGCSNQIAMLLEIKMGALFYLGMSYLV